MTGCPQVTCVWVGLDGDDIVCAHLPRHRKVRNIERDPRVALSIEADGTDDLGLKRYLVIYGEARVTEEGAPELLQRLAATYLGPEVFCGGSGATCSSRAIDAASALIDLGNVRIRQ
jgi:PPOX class probable F420-dependent enzyme